MGTIVKYAGGGYKKLETGDTPFLEAAMLSYTYKI